MSVLKILVKSGYIAVLVVGTGVCIAEIITSILDARRGDDSESEDVKGYKRKESNRRE